MLLNLIIEFDRLARAAIANGVELSNLVAIPAKEKIGRAKTVPADQYKAEYTAIGEEMRREIEEASQGGEDA